MFGIINFENNRCFGVEESDLPLEDYYRGYKVIAFPHAVVPKDYINIWKSGHKCEREGCFKDGLVVCRVPEYESVYHRDPDMKEAIMIEHLCPDHAYDAGYCTLCGEFWGGIESFDFENPSHLCEHCIQQVRDEQGDYDDDDMLDTIAFEED